LEKEGDIMSEIHEDEENLEELLKMEQELMADLKKLFRDPGLSVLERVRIANALAYHAVVLNDLRSKKGEKKQYDEDTLGDFVAGINFADGRMRRQIRRDFRDWTRKLSSNK
jgi:hypothetical protein